MSRTIPNLTAAEGRAILALGPMRWGRGKTAHQAVQRLRQEMSWLDRRKVTVKLLDVDEQAYVDEMGAVCWRSEKERPTELQTITITNYKARA